MTGKFCNNSYSPYYKKSSCESIRKWQVTWKKILHRNVITLVPLRESFLPANPENHRSFSLLCLSFSQGCWWIDFHQSLFSSCLWPQCWQTNMKPHKLGIQINEIINAPSTVAAMVSSQWIQVLHNRIVEEIEWDIVCSEAAKVPPHSESVP